MLSRAKRVSKHAPAAQALAIFPNGRLQPSPILGDIGSGPNRIRL
jgi:hypothetical protein